MLKFELSNLFAFSSAVMGSPGALSMGSSVTCELLYERMPDMNVSYFFGLQRSVSPSICVEEYAERNHISKYWYMKGNFYFYRQSLCIFYHANVHVLFGIDMPQVVSYAIGNRVKSIGSSSI